MKQADWLIQEVVQPDDVTLAEIEPEAPTPRGVGKARA
jgi:hypothetical protein